MKNRTCLQDFAKYASLNVLGMIGLSCYILADTFFVSQGMGTNGLAALNLAIPIYGFIHGSGLMLGMGGATKYSIAQSQNAPDRANCTFTRTVLFTLDLSAVFLLIGLFFSGGITRLLGADGAVFEMSKTYLQVILLFAPMFMLNNVLLCFVRNDGAPQLAMAAMLTGSFSNIVLDYVFIFPFGMGIFGAVLATGLAPVISMLTLLPFFLKKRNRFHMVKCKFAPKRIRGILASGLPSFITEASSGVVMILFNAIILGLLGNVGVAAYGVIANLSLVVIAIYTGIAQGIQPLVSSSHGAGDRANVQAVMRYALICLVAVSAVIYAAVFFGAKQIAGAFNSEQNALLQSIAENGLKIYFTGGLFAGFNIIVSVYFTSTERARPAHVISILRGFALVVPMAAVLSSVGGMTGVWCVFPATELLVAGIGLWRYLSARKAGFQKAGLRA